MRKSHSISIYKYCSGIPRVLGPRGKMFFVPLRFLNWDQWIAIFPSYNSDFLSLNFKIFFKDISKSRKYWEMNEMLSFYLRLLTMCAPRGQTWMELPCHVNALSPRHTSYTVTMQSPTYKRYHHQARFHEHCQTAEYQVSRCTHCNACSSEIWGQRGWQGDALDGIFPTQSQKPSSLNVRP